MKGQPVHILLIEDNPDHAELILRNLKSIQLILSIRHIEDGEAAIEYFSNSAVPLSQPIIVLLDLRLPKIDGLEVLRFLKSDDNLKYIPVIILTTSEAEKDVAMAYQYNANSYLVKPIDFIQFTELLHTFSDYWILLNKSSAKC